MSSNNSSNKKRKPVAGRTGGAAGRNGKHRQLFLEFPEWLPTAPSPPPTPPPSVAIDAEAICHLCGSGVAGGGDGEEEEEVVSVRVLGRLDAATKSAAAAAAASQKKRARARPTASPPREGTQASHSFARVKAVAAGETSGGMPPDFYGPGLEGVEPTDALPGTSEKIDVLAGRAGRRQILFHPQDARPETQ